ncbi:hypothetical protein N9I73_01720 [Porticoccaceae bacterium]|nr:hypothetical protein [Porticoccaceae bacterium]MDA9014281.1 hypothetical protein [Porticoccaceae bacterium]
MNLSFLCDAHRQELTTNVTKAIRFWQEGFDTAQFFNEQSLWLEAIPHAGCAFEAAEIFVTNKEIDYTVAYEWFYASTILLAKAFNSLGNTDEAYEVMGLAIERFDRELALSNVEQKLVMDYLNKLHWCELFEANHIESKHGMNRSSVLSVQ